MSSSFPIDFPWSPHKRKTDIELLREHCKVGTPILKLTNGKETENNLILRLMDELELFREYVGTPYQAAALVKDERKYARDIAVGADIKVSYEEFNQAEDISSRIDEYCKKAIEQAKIAIAQEVIKQSEELMDFVVYQSPNDPYKITVKGFMTCKSKKNKEIYRIEKE